MPPIYLGHPLGWTQELPKVLYLVQCRILLRHDDHQWNRADRQVPLRLPAFAIAVSGASAPAKP